MMTTKVMLWSVAGALAIWAVAQPLRPLVVVGNSMAPTYRSGEWLWTKPIDRTLQRGDVVLADSPNGPVIKRVVLLPGDRRLQWQSPSGWLDLTTVGTPLRGRKPIFGRIRTRVVPAGTVFLLGDNVMSSVDSREFGPVEVEKIRRLVVDARSPDVGAGVSKPIPQRWIVGAIRHMKLLGT